MSSFLTAEWRRLAIANYSIDPSLLKPHLPFGTELDFWKDKCYVSLVGFRFINTKLKGISVPFHQHFEEINLRFYVRHKNGDLWKRGVTFLKEIVSKRALTFIANSVYRENYVTLPTKYSWATEANLLDVNYQWKHAGKWDVIRVMSKSSPKNIAIESEEEFITEHYWGYTRVNGQRTSQYQVEHPRWQTYEVVDYEINARFGKLYGEAFSFLEKQKPDSVMLAEGSEIIVRNASKINLD